MLENEKVKIYWNLPFILEKPRENGANNNNDNDNDNDNDVIVIIFIIICLFIFLI